MAGLPPTDAFSRADLDIETVDAGQIIGRIHRRDYPDPLGFGKNASRFSDPRRRVSENRFGVLYLGSTLKVCLVEAILRDRRDGLVGDVVVDERELGDRLYSQICVQTPLRLVDLRGDNAMRMGIPSDVVRGRTQGLARKWSLAIYEHPTEIDGIIYPSRLNTETNFAIYDRGVGKLVPVASGVLDVAPGIADALDAFAVALV